MRACTCGAESDDGSSFWGSCGLQLNASIDSSRSYAVDEVFGSYRLVRQIGQGGMGRVFIAEHTRLERQVALKMLRSEYSDNAEAVKRFFAEARAVNRIKHENIIEITDFIENSRGHSFYIMELLKGVDLRTLNQREGALPIGRALGIAIQICRGLGAAHQAGIVHRDLKPDNIFLVERADTKDFVKLLDFGVAKLVDDSLDDLTAYRTTAGVVVGTPEYMAPEQAAGGPADRRSDIYALGVILFEMITGQRPFDAPSAREVMAHHVMLAPPRPSKILRFGKTIPSALEDLILACLKKAPADRPQTMQEIERQLDAIARRLSVSILEVGQGRWRWRDRRIWATAAAAIAVSLLVGGVVARVRHGGAPEAGRSAEKLSRVAGSATVPAPAPVEVAFDSYPRGATVSRPGHGKPLGTTPFSARFAASPVKERFEFSKVGWRSKSEELTLLSNMRIEVALEPVDIDPPDNKPPVVAGARPASKARVSRPTSTAASSTAEAQKLDHGVVLDPFQ